MQKDLISCIFKLIMILFLSVSDVSVFWWLWSFKIYVFMVAAKFHFASASFECVIMHSRVSYSHIPRDLVLGSLWDVQGYQEEQFRRSTSENIAFGLAMKCFYHSILLFTCIYSVSVGRMHACLTCMGSVGY